MDARVNDFLNEINEIAPLSESKEENAWEKCFDEESGYHYYWHTKTNEVTWDVPPDYKNVNKVKTKKSMNLYMPPRTAPLFPSTISLPPVSEAIKIYKIGECADSSKVSFKKDFSGSVIKKEDKKVPVKRPFPRRPSDSDDEKIVLISSYGGDSESDEEEKTPNRQDKQMNGSNHNSDEEDILTKMQKCARELKSLKPPPAQKSPKASAALSLVAGYSDSEEEESEVEDPESPKVAHSTLFPIPTPIDIKDFESQPKPEIVKPDFDSKAFQRKRRIGVALVNTTVKKPDLSSDDELVRKGLGFSNETGIENSGGTSTYPGFKSGGVMFVKADVLNEGAEKVEKVSREVEEGYTTLKGKLGFLSEGREEVSPVQVMLIQLETLFTALKSGDLKQNYLRKWLDETCSDLVKLEKEAAPEGWLLQWDRSHKRYYYQNEDTEESQWEYPQADVTVCDEAMDICTTPPPSGSDVPIHMSPPLPPIIGSPSPPPPPTISDCGRAGKKKKGDIPMPSLPSEPIKRSDKCDSNGEPLPPGVDLPEASQKSAPSTEKNTNELSDALSSFYSDIAAIETNDSAPISGAGEDTNKVAEENADGTEEPAKKKKKPKVKLTQGIAMKKKGVSKLVEKWKSVQMSYND